VLRRPMRRRHQRNSCRFRPFRSLFVGPALGSRSAKRHENNCRLTVLSVADNRGPFVPAVTVAEILRSARLSAVDVCSGARNGLRRGAGYAGDQVFRIRLVEHLFVHKRVMTVDGALDRPM